MKRLLTLILAAAVWMQGLTSLQVQIPRAHADQICDANCQKLIDDPEQRSLVDRLVNWIHDARHASAGNVSNLFRGIIRIIHDVFAYLAGIFTSIHNQVESSKCHTRDCSSYGVNH